ncbi:MAG: PAS domain-containing protein, partial [Gammaproteobacteria bacterium]|nr:PAS domain-containing protein [Gammaproteobacteria bacterium]
MSKLTLQQKFITFLIVTLLVVLALNGLLFIQLFASRSTEIHKQKIYRAVEELHEELNALEQKNLGITKGIAERQDFISSINLINHYQDITNYQPLIFDVEKEKLARELYLIARSTGTVMAAIYDEHQQLVAFFSDDGSEVINGYASYEGGRRKILATLGTAGEFSPIDEKRLPKLVLSEIFYEENRISSRLVAEKYRLYSATTNYLHTSHIDGKEQRIGRVVIAKAITVKDITSALAHLGVEFSILFSGTKPSNELERLYVGEGVPHQPTLADSHKLEHKNLPLYQRGNYLFGAVSLPIFGGDSSYFVVGLQREQIEQQTLDFRNSALIVLLLTAIFIIPLAIHLMNRGLLRPLKLLSNGVQNLRKGEYIKIEGFYKRDELGLLAESFNNMVSDLKRREDQLRTLSMATEQSPVSILITNPDHIIEYINPQFESTTGFNTNDVIGHSIEILFKQSDLDQQTLDALNASISLGNTWSGEFSNLKKGGEHYSIRTSISPIKLADGSTSHYLYIAEDTTAQRKGEEILRSSQKMDAIGQLTGGIAHDFNNILGIIMGNLELLRIELKDHPKEMERIDRALSGTRRGAKLTQKLLGFSRQDRHGQEITHINRFIEGMHELISKSLTAVIQVETNLADDLWPIEV